mmetsp:Transcript_2747/g.6481  ORF Transcript_2747/g.6481 Transcript_2747/m.6481 type:complete len:463 (-) Transcript_2747:538-1926(-)
MLLANLLYIRLDGFQTVPRELGEQVVLNLVFQPAVEPVVLPIAVHVARGLQLEGKELLSSFLLRREARGRQVAQQQLHMQNPRRPVGNQHKEQPRVELGQQPDHGGVPAPENRHPQNVHGSGHDTRPSRRGEQPLDGPAGGNEVEVEPTHQDAEGEEGPVLDVHQSSGEQVHLHARNLQLLLRDQPQGQIVKLRVLLRSQRDSVVHGVLLVPHGGGDPKQDAPRRPGHGVEPAPLRRVHHSVVCCVVRQERGLLPADPQQARGPEHHPPRPAPRDHRGHGHGEESGSNSQLPPIERRPGGEVPLPPELLPELAVLDRGRGGGRRTAGLPGLSGEVPNAERGQPQGHPWAVEGGELVAGVRASELVDDRPPGVVVGKRGHVVDAPLNGKPDISLAVVLLDLLPRVGDSGLGPRRLLHLLTNVCPSPRRLLRRPRRLGRRPPVPFFSTQGPPRRGPYSYQAAED